MFIKLILLLVLQSSQQLREITEVAQLGCSEINLES